MGSLMYEELREELCVTAKLIFERRLTNAVGGNYAVRAAEGHVLITPAFMSERKHSSLEPGDILLIDYDKNIIDGEGQLTREVDMHLALLTKYVNIGATLHAHPFHCMPFVAAGKPVPGMTEATEEKGDAGCIPFARAYTPELAAAVSKYFEDRRELAERTPLGVVLPRHGVLVTGNDIYSALSMLELMETDAYCAICSKLI
jgi:L-fuculose-phosphate aldolase